MNIKIEKMNKMHLEEIKEILIDQFDEFWSENVLKQELENPASEYIVALDEQNNVVGYAGIWKPIDEAHITNIVTKKDKRRNQIGTRMLEELINLAQKEKLKLITLEVNVNNVNAIKLYTKFDFKEVGKRKKYYKGTDDALIMTKLFN